MAKFFKYKLLPAIILLCCLFRATGEPIVPVPTKDAAARLLQLLKSAHADTNQVNILLPLAQFYLDKDDASIDSAQLYITKAFALSKALHYFEGEIKSQYLQATPGLTTVSHKAADSALENGIALSRQKGKIELEALGYYYKAAFLSFDSSAANKKLDYYKRSMDLYQQAGNKVLEAYLLKTIADTHYILGYFSLALRELLDALSIYKSAGYTKLHFTYDLISVLYARMGNYEEAVQYGLASIKSAENSRDTANLIFFYYRFAALKVDLKDYDQALRAAYTGMELSKQFTGNPIIHSYISFIAGLLANSGKPAEGLRIFTDFVLKNPPLDSSQLSRNYEFLGTLNFKLKRYTTAENYYLKVLALKSASSGTHKNYYDISFYLELADLYVTTKQFLKAKKFLQEALTIQSVSSSLQKAQIQQLLFSVDSAEGNYKGAIAHLQLYKSITDSIFNDTKSRHIASLQIQYETKKKEQDIKLLSSENKKQQVILKQRLFQRNVMIAGIGMLLLLFWLGFTRYSLKQRANLQLKAQQETINHKNEVLEYLVNEKEDLLINKDELITEKEALITEKEWLIKEVHHRVKNNLQMVSALLYTQSNYLEDEQALAAVLESQQRIYAISLIHQKLYQSDNLQIINMQSYIHELVDYLKESMNDKSEIEFQLLIEPLDLDIIKAIPIGLILNEAITNSLKYAFSNNQKKIISVTLCSGQQNEVELVIRDNGKGLSGNFNLSTSGSLGMNLMQGLAKQVKGTFDIKNEQGVVVIIHFNTTV